MFVITLLSTWKCANTRYIVIYITTAQYHKKWITKNDDDGDGDGEDDDGDDDDGDDDDGDDW